MGEPRSNLLKSNLVEQEIINELREQLAYTHYRAVDACEDCKTKAVIGLGKLKCDTPPCIATQVLYELAKQSYDCVLIPLENGSVLVMLTELDSYGWGWFLVYRGRLDFELAYSPLEDYEPVHQKPRILSLKDFCKEFEWKNADQ